MQSKTINRIPADAMRIYQGSWKYLLIMTFGCIANLVVSDEHFILPFIYGSIFYIFILVLAGIIQFIFELFIKKINFHCSFLLTITLIITGFIFYDIIISLPETDIIDSAADKLFCETGIYFLPKIKCGMSKVEIEYATFLFSGLVYSIFSIATVDMIMPL